MIRDDADSLWDSIKIAHAIRIPIGADVRLILRVADPNHFRLDDETLAKNVLLRRSADYAGDLLAKEVVRMV